MIIDNISIVHTISIESIAMVIAHGLPGQWMSVSFHTKNASGDLANVDSASIKIKDPTDTTRVSYTAANLVNEDTGKYRYDFQIPTVIIAGDWYIEITCTIGSRESVRTSHFEVSSN